MAFRSLLRPRPVSPIAVGAFTASLFLFPRSTLHAESPPESLVARKPIYDDYPTMPATLKPKPTPSEEAPTSSHNTPTARLAGQIRHLRLFIHAHAAAAEDRLDAFMSTFLAHERSFTQTIASLAPPPESRERVMPGALYVLVAAMAGSIVSRNRNVLLRATVPFAVGLGAAWVVLPVTMGNVSELVWRYEEMAPVVAINHLRIRGAVEEGWRQVRVRGEEGRKWSDERVREGREVVERWIRKGR